MRDRLSPGPVQVRYDYHPLLSAESAPEGGADLEFHVPILSNGRVKGAKVVRSDVGDSDFRKCVTKQIKNRLHLDLRPDNQVAQIARAEAMGAQRIDIGQNDECTWVVLADPEGNEFCILKELESE